MSLFARKAKKQTDEALFYDEYKEIRDEAWRVLAEHDVDSLPVDLTVLCEAEGIDVYSYSMAEVLISSLHIEKQLTSGGFTVLMPEGRSIVLFDDALPVEMRRWLIACGIGCFALGFAEAEKCNERTVLQLTAEEQKQVGIFAGRLLAPLSVLWGMGVQSAEEIAQVCRIPKATAEKRFARLLEMEERNLERGMQTGQGTMFLSGYERSAYRKFSRFTEKYRQDKKLL